MERVRAPSDIEIAAEAGSDIPLITGGFLTDIVHCTGLYLADLRAQF